MYYYFLAWTTQRVEMQMLLPLYIYDINFFFVCEWVSECVYVCVGELYSSNDLTF